MEYIFPLSTKKRRFKVYSYQILGDLRKFSCVACSRDYRSNCSFVRTGAFALTSDRLRTSAFVNIESPCLHQRRMSGFRPFHRSCAPFSVLHRNRYRAAAFAKRASTGTGCAREACLRATNCLVRNVSMPLSSVMPSAAALAISRPIV